MRRRSLLIGAAGFTAGAPRLARAQSSGVARVGVLIAGDVEPNWSLFRKAMTALGRVEGRSIRYELRVSDANRERLAAHAASLVSANVDILVAMLTPAVVAAQQATTKIPVVFSAGIPETGLVGNLARPEGNLTGVFSGVSVVAGKSIQLFREIKPSTKSIAVLLNAPDPFNVPLRREVEAAGKAQQLEIVPVMLSTPQELAPAFDALARRGVDGVAIQPSLPLKESAALALQHRLPALSYRRVFVEVGGLMSYGADQSALSQMLASYTDRVLKGTRTTDLPVQMASRFELVINQKTARAMGLTLSPMFLGRADEVIE